MVRKSLRVSLGAVCLVLLLLPATAGAQQEMRVAMRREPNRFEPASLTVPVGTRVTWVNEAGNHTTTSETGAWDSGMMAAGASFSFTFTQPGTYSYVCVPHRAQGMVGTITVAGAQAPGTLPRAGEAEASANALAAAGLAAGALVLLAGARLRFRERTRERRS